MIVTLLISVTSLVILLNTETDESSAQDHISAGQCGRNLRYCLYSDGTLEIIGFDEMYQYDNSYAPWHKYRDNITKIVISPDTDSLISKLGTSAFRDCKNVTELTIPITLNSVVSDKNPVFSGCCNIEKINFTFGNGGWGYDYAAYEGSDSWYQNTPWYQSRDTLKEIVFAKGINRIGHDAFRELNITSIVIPDTVVNLGNHCFFKCTKLTDLTLPVSLNSYGSDARYPAFNGCAAVQKVTFTKGNGIPFDYTGNNHDPYNIYLAPWNMYPHIEKTIIIENDITELGSYMFFKCNIKELTVPINIDFEGCMFEPPYKNLEKVTITKGIDGRTHYPYWPDIHYPWLGNYNLNTVIFEEGVTYIMKQMFNSCGMENLILPNTLVSFEELTFQNCRIKNLTIPISLNASWLDDECAFDGVSGMEKVNFIPGSGYGFDYAAYEGNNCWYQKTPWYQCKNTLKEISFAEGITHIGSDALRELNATSLVIPNSVESLGCHAFYQMTKLSSLTIPATLDSVASKKYPAFDGCTHIEKVTFTGSGDWFDYGYSDLEPHYFYYEYGFRTPWQLSKSALKIVDIMPDVTSVGKHAFETCNSLECITVADSVKFIGECAFNATFYETDGVTKLQETADDLAGYTFKNFNGKWIKQKESGTCGEVFYEFDQFTGTLTIRGSGNMESYSSGKAPWYSDKDLITSIVIEDNVTSIGDFAFEDITSIKSIIIPNSVGHIGEYTFKGCSSLASYVVSENNNNYTSIDGILLSKDMSVLVKYPVAKAGTFFEIPDYVKTIAPSAFNGCTSLTFITIPYSVETIKDGAFDVTFYDTNGETALDLTIENLAGFTFYKVEDRWIKQNISGECGDSVSYKMDCSKGTLIISGSGQMYDFSIGETPWYSFKDFVLSVNIGDSVTSIGDYAFYGCASLSTITIPNSVESIGASAFFGCHSLTAIAIPDSVTILKVYAFQDCSSLTSITIPDSVITIASHAFYGCSSLTSITIPDSVTTLGEQVFYGCISLTSVTLSIFIKSLGNYAFCGCTSLPSVSLPSSIRSIGFSAFYGCTSLRSITIPDSVESIGASAFKACASLTAITIPDSITSLENNAFDGKFYDSNGVKELEQTVENLVGSIFYNNDGRWIKQNLSGECGDSVSYKMDCSKGTLIISGSGQMYDFSIGGTPWYLFRDSILSVDIESSVSSIGECAFYGCTSLTSITIPESVSSIGKSAFFECASLTSITIPDSVTILQIFVFQGCTSLTSIIIPDSVTSIRSHAFYGCSSLTSVTIPDSVTTLGEQVFYGCTSLTSVTLPNFIKFIGNFTFSGCTSLTSVSLPSSIRSIGFSAFYGCTSLRSITIPDSVESIGASAFKACASLTAITIPDSITSLENNAFDGKFYDSNGEKELEQTVENLAGFTFYKVDNGWIKHNLSGECGDSVSYKMDCSKGTLIISGSGQMYDFSAGETPWYLFRDSIHSVDIEDSVTSIGDYAFYGCTSLSIVKIGKSLDSVKKSAFKGCTSLALFVVSNENDAFSSIDGVLLNNSKTTLMQYPAAKTDTTYEIPASVTYILPSAFKGCTFLKSLTIPDSVTTVETGAFDMMFYAVDGETELEPTVENLAGSIFNNIDGKWIKQKESGTCGDDVRYEFNQLTGTLTISGSGAMYNYAYGTTPWDPYKGSIRSVVIGDSVTSIGAYAFSDCTSLVIVTIPDSIRSIGDFAFEGNTSLDSITLPDTIESLGNSAFESCSELTTIDLGRSVNHIGDAAFYECSSLASFVVSDENDAYVSIEGVLFSKDMQTLVHFPSAKEGTSYVIPNSVTTIRSYAFEECESLTSVTISSSITTLEHDAFDAIFYDSDGETPLDDENLAGFTFNYVDNKWIKQTSISSEDPIKDSDECGEGVTYELNLSTGILTISGSGQMRLYSSGNAPWFSHKESIKSIEIADSIRSIGDFAFEGITSIESIAIPDSVETIGVSAFECCSKLTTVNIGKSVKSINEVAFKGCISLALFVVSNDNDAFTSIDGVLFNNDRSTLIQYPPAKEGNSYRIPNSVTTIRSYAFDRCYSLTSITIPDSVTTIEDDAFDMPFYDEDGETEIEPTATNLAGYTYTRRN